jgi:DNA-binding response OmpR family regulator
LSDYLTFLGYAVQGVGTLAEAEVALNQGFALLVLDINLPDGSGLEFSMRVGPYVRAGIVMMTGRSERALRIQGLKGGADAYLVKPVDPEELDATLQSILRRMGGRRYSLLKAAPMPVQWRVDHIRLTLTGPNGKACKLTNGECLVLVTLVQAQGQLISHADLLESLERQGGASTGRRVEALISRLRSKVMAEFKLELPVQSMYGQGYAFSDHALVI